MDRPAVSRRLKLLVQENARLKAENACLLEALVRLETLAGAIRQEVAALLKQREASGAMEAAGNGAPGESVSSQGI